MNKEKLNRKIQILEEENLKLRKYIFEDNHTKCVECSKLKNKQMLDFRETMRIFENNWPEYIKRRY